MMRRADTDTDTTSSPHTDPDGGSHRLGDALRDLSEALPPARPLFWRWRPRRDDETGDDDDEDEEDYGESVPARAVWAYARRLASDLAKILPATPEDLKVGTVPTTPPRADASQALVGIYAEPSAEYVAAVVGTLWAGAAWVPLDRAWSTQRLTRVVSVTELSAVIVLPSSSDGSSSSPPDSSPTWAIFHRAVTPDRVLFPPPNILAPDLGGVSSRGSPPAMGTGRRRPPAGMSPALPPVPIPLPTPESSPGPRDVCYVMFTSGSTGAPKGVRGTHAGIHARVKWAMVTPPLRMRGGSGDDDRGCVKTGVGFVDSVAEIFCPLLQGAASVVTAREGVGAGGGGGDQAGTSRSVDPIQRLAVAVCRGGVTHLTAVPSQWVVLLPVFRSLAVRGKGLRLRTCTSSGEPLPMSLLRGMLALEAHRRPLWSSSSRSNREAPLCVFNLYGSTEVGGDATGLGFMASGGQISSFWYHGWDQDDLVRGGVVRQRLRVDHLDPAASYVPAGHSLPYAGVMLIKPPTDGVGAWMLVKEVNEVGEVVVFGNGVAAGYEGGTGITRMEKKDDGNDSFTTLGALVGEGVAGLHARERVHRTGDLGRWSPSGCLLLDGRTDDVVNVFGERVALREVEAAALEVMEEGENGGSIVVASAARYWSTADINRHTAATGEVPGFARWHDGSDDDTDDRVGGVVAVYVVVALSGEVKVGDSGETTDDIRRRVVESCHQRGLPRVACPPKAAVEILDALPLTETGKLDRAALPFPSHLIASQWKSLSGRKRKGSSGAPITADRVLQGMRVVLGSSQVTALSDDFFQAGGASPDAVALAHILGIPVRIIYEHRTPAAIAAAGFRPSHPLFTPTSPSPSRIRSPILAEPGDNRGLSTGLLPHPSPHIGSDEDEDTPPLRPESGCMRRAWSAHLGGCVDARPLLFNLKGGDSHGEKETRGPRDCHMGQNGTWHVVIGSHSREVRCMRADSGQLVWRTVLPGRVEAGAVLANRHADTIAVPCLDGKVHFLQSLKGDLLWSYDTGGEVKGELTADDSNGESDSGSESKSGVERGFLLWGQSHSGMAFAINPVQQRAVWTLPSAGAGVAAPAVWSRSPGMVTVDNIGDKAYGGSRFCRSTVFFATLAGIVIAVDGREATSEKGEDGVVWRATVGAPVFSSPAVVPEGRAVCVASVAGVCTGLRLGDGTRLWAVDVGSPVYAGLILLPPSPATPPVSGRITTTTPPGSLRSEGHLMISTARGEVIGLWVGDDKTERAWRWSGRGRLRGAPAVVPPAEGHGPGKDDPGHVTVVGAWDSGEVNVVRPPNHRGARVGVGGEGVREEEVHAVALVRLPGAVFSPPAVLSSEALGVPHPAVFVGCRDDFLHCVKIDA